jgi:hypothetical protein
VVALASGLDAERSVDDLRYELSCSSIAPSRVVTDCWTRQLER